MYQAKWKDRVFSITSNTIRTLTELGTSYKIKKKTDNTSSTTVIDGHELQSFTINYEVSLVAGVNPLTEYNTMKSYLGAYSPLLLQGKLYEYYAKSADASIKRTFIEEALINNTTSKILRKLVFGK